MKLTSVYAAMAVAGLGIVASPHANASPDPYLGELTLYPYNFCPRGWAPADGKLLSISENTALFSLYGTTFGGDGRNTFALPDLRGRTVVGTGEGPGLTNRRWGQRFGSEVTTLSEQNLPAHSHEASMIATNGSPDVPSPAGSSVANFTGGGFNTYSTEAPNEEMAKGSVAISSTGGSQPFNNVQPSVAVQYCVAMQGVFPSRN